MTQTARTIGVLALRRSAVFLTTDACRLAILVFICAVSAADVCAQYSQSSSLTDRQTPAAFAPGLPSGNIDSVDLFSGRVSVSFPLFRFGGRGEAGYTAYVSINRTFNIRSIQTWSSPGYYPGQWRDPRYSLRSEGFYEDLGRSGAKAGLKPGIMMAHKMRNGNPDPTMSFPDNTSPEGVFCYTLTKLYFRTSTGQIEFRDAGTNGTDQYMHGTQTYNRGKVWVSRDGSAMTFVSDADISDESCAEADYQSMNSENYIFPSGYLYAKNGVRYRIADGEVVWMRDRNGNLLTVGGNSYDTKTVTDAAGRTYTIQTLTGGGAVMSQSVQYKGTGGAARTMSATYTQLSDALRDDAVGRGGVKSLQTLFPEILWESPTLLLNPRVLSEITLADGRKYRFKYNEFGELARIEHLNGSIVEFDYAPAPVPSVMGNGVWFGPPPQIYRRVTERRFYDKVGVLSGRTTYQFAVESNGQVATRAKVFGGDGTLLSYTKHYFMGSVEATYSYTGFWPPYSDGRESKVEECDASGAALVRQDNTWVPDSNSTALLTEVKRTLVPTNDVKKITYAYDQYANVTDTFEYDYGPGSPGALLRRSHTEYKTEPAYTDRAGAHLRDLVREMWVAAGTAVDKKLAYKVLEYDNYTADPNNGGRHAELVPRDHISGLCTTHDAAGTCSNTSAALYTTRGNVTGTTSYILDRDGNTVGAVTANQQYDIAGNVVKSIDARLKPDRSGYETVFDFQDRYGAPDIESQSNSIPPELAGPSGTLDSYALPTATTNALGHTSYMQYDYYTGRPVNKEDANGVVSSTRYEDLLDRATRMDQAVNLLGLHGQTSVVYDDLNRTVITTTDQNELDDNRLKTMLVYDGLGQTVETRQYETATQYAATLTKYDALGRTVEVSNPYRSTLAEAPIWTTTAYDLLGRVSTVTTSDGARVYSLYHGLRVLVTDQAGKQRLSRMDGLEQLVEVWEIVSPDPASGTEAVSFPVPEGIPVPGVAAGYRTNYKYDALGKLRQVEQGEQRRFFAYDSLGRLIRMSSPEHEANAALALSPDMLNSPADSNNSWSVAYKYDENGSLLKKTDARGGETAYVYDALNRITRKSYTDILLPQGRTVSTPPVNYFYDTQPLPAGGPSFDRGAPVGRLVAVTYGGATSTTGSYAGMYDALGRPHYSAQVTAAPDASGQSVMQTYAFGYDYYLDGNLKSETYPSGRVIKSEYDVAGRLAGVKKGDGNYYAGGDPTVADNPNVIAYTAHGAVAALRFGNGLWEHMSFNARQQLEESGLGTSRDDSSVLKLEYGYGLATAGSATDQTKNNGNLRSQKIVVPAVGTLPTQTFIQSYTYDELNRLKVAEERDGTNPLWKQVYTYDRFGNRRLDAAQTTLPKLTQPGQTSPPEVANPGVQPLTNRLAEDQNGDGNKEYSYDKMGNLVCDAQHCTPAPARAAYYDYDGENKMVAVGGGFANGGTSYVYDGDGNRVRKSTYNGEVTVFVYDSTGQVAAEYSNQTPVGGTSYFTQDLLGSTRVVTGQDQSIKTRSDYFPFGEEMQEGVPGRVAARGYGEGNARQKFAGKEHDTETGLDYLIARYYAPVQGRFTTADPILFDLARLSDPQKLNLYAYSRNNPVNMMDPDGKEPRWGQLGNLSDILTVISNAFAKYVEDHRLNYSGMNNPSISLEFLAKAFEGNRLFTRDSHNNIVDAKGSAPVDRYIYTESRGWIDMHHFFKLAEVTNDLGQKAAELYASNSERYQNLPVVGNVSGWSYEDYASDIAGIEFWLQYGDNIKAGKISVLDATSEFLTKLGAVEPIKAPNYDFIPHIANEFVLQSGEKHGLKGDALREQHLEVFNRRPREQQEAIRQAHQTVPHSSNHR